MKAHLKGILVVALALSLPASAATIANAGTTFTTSKPVLSGTPHKDKSFTASGIIKPKSTAQSRKPGAKYSCAIIIPMVGAHGVQAVQYRGGKVVSRSRITYFTVQR
jgi:hypothetical protein